MDPFFGSFLIVHIDAGGIHTRFWRSLPGFRRCVCFLPESLVRHEKGALLQWEEDIPPGSCCSNRKQPERSLLVTAVVEASGAKRSRNGDQARTQVEI